LTGHGHQFHRLPVSPARDRFAHRRQEGVETRERASRQAPPLWRVVLHNDDYTSMEFVVAVLQAVFNHSEAAATRIMLHIHHNGVGVAGVYSYEVAETKVRKVLALAKEAEYPLLCTMEPD